MKRKNKKILDDEINLIEIISLLWKKKKIIFYITLAFTVAGYFYSNLQFKSYQYDIKLQASPEFVFKKYSYITSFGKPIDISLELHKYFNKNFKLNLTSLDNIKNFVEQNDKLVEFKSFLKKNSIETKAYFNDKIKVIDNSESADTYQLRFKFNKAYKFENFFHDYVFFTKQTIENKIKQRLLESINSEIKFYNQNIQIAKQLNLEDPHPNANPSFQLYYSGSKALSFEKLILEQTRKEIENFMLDYNPILEQVTNQDHIPIKTPSIFFIFIGFALGLFASFTLITVKYFIKIVS